MFGIFCNGIQVDTFDTQSVAKDFIGKMPQEREIIPGRKIKLAWEVRPLVSGDKAAANPPEKTAEKASILGALKGKFSK